MTPFGVPQILPGSGPDMADAYNYNAPVVAQHLQQAWQQVQDPRFWADAANKWAQGILMGTTAPEFGGLAGGTAGIRAFHGSPYDFDRFSSSNIGTGEGAQAYGHGLYFAGNEGVARAYRDGLSGSPDSVISIAGNGGVDKIGRQAAETLDQWRQTFSKYGKTPEEIQEIAAEQARRNGSPEVADRILSFPPDAAIERGSPGRMYEVNIAASPDQLLDWDKPVSLDHPAVPIVEATRNQYQPDPALSSLGNANFRESVANGDVTGSDLWDRLVTLSGSPQSAAETLRQAGIPGIKYLDAGSRGEGQGTHNYVVFNDNLINILRKYAAPGMVGAGAASAPFGFGVGAQQ